MANFNELTDFVIDYSDTWRSHDPADGSPCSYVVGQTNLGRIDRVFTRAALDARDVRLALLIDQLKIEGCVEVEADVIRYSLKYWGSLQVDCFAEAMYLTGHSSINIGESRVFIGYNSYSLAKLAKGLDYATAASFQTRVIETCWLNEHRPGWEERYRLATELGLSTPEAVVHMFSQSLNNVLPQEITLHKVDLI